MSVKQILFISLAVLTFSAWVAPAEAAIAKAAGEMSPIEQFLRPKCERNDAQGCLDLGLFHQEVGKKAEAKLAFAKACKLGSNQACTQAR